LNKRIYKTTGMNMKYCNKCGEKIAENAKYCKKCGNISIYSNVQSLISIGQQNVYSGGIGVKIEQSTSLDSIQKKLDTLSKDHQKMKNNQQSIKGSIKTVSKSQRKWFIELQNFLKSKITRFDDLETIQIELNNKINELRTQMHQLEIEGKNAKSAILENELKQMKMEVKKTFHELQLLSEEILSSLEEFINRYEITEKFLKDHLGSDWEKMKESWKDYRKGLIGKKELLKRGILAGGKKFIKLITGNLIDI